MAIADNFRYLIALATIRTGSRPLTNECANYFRSIEYGFSGSLENL